MRTLAARIRRELRKSALPIPYCAIYEEELQRFFPSELQNREAEIEKFAKQHGFKLRFYKRGLCAIFQEDVQNYGSRVIQHSARKRPKRWEQQIAGCRND